MLTTKSLSREVRELSLRFMRDLDTPISLSVFLMVKYGEWDQLAAKRIDPCGYLDAVSITDRFRRDYQAVSFLRKFEGLPTNQATMKDDCVKAFYESEATCRKSNLRLDNFVFPVGLDGRLMTFLSEVQKVVSKILGRLPDDLECRFGPGSTFEFKRSDGAISRNPCGKLRSSIYCTPSSAAVVEYLTSSTMWQRAVLKEYPERSALRYVRGNRFTTVPKDATKLRGICVEPGGNVWAQLGVGSYLRRRLKFTAGIDLNHGQDLHAKMAQEGSVKQTRATIDLSNASDTICSKLVELCLARSPEWYLLLLSLRSPMTRVNGKWVWLEKFSSMGNGFTFELETIVFYAISLVASGRPFGDPDVKVYGDDIIVPTERAADVVSALRFFGFTPNPKKTFLSGPFRESCGGDFFLGTCVTPVYLKKDPKQPSEWISLANGLYGVRDGFRTSLLVRKHVGLSLRVYGPSGLGDCVLHERDPRRWTFVWRHGIRYFRGWVPVTKGIPMRRYRPTVQLAAALYGVPSSGPVPRDAVSGFRYRWLAFS